MTEYWDSFVAFILKIIYSCFAFLKDMFWWVIDMLFTASQAVLNTLASALDGLNPLLYIDSIPEQTKGFMSLVGFNESMAIIITAIGIRFVLQMIPFVRWGS
jgi:hypothetical protein